MAEALHSKFSFFIICICSTVLGMSYNYEAMKVVNALGSHLCQSILHFLNFS